eukprot:SAG31_NODE_39758_length_285_cov_1.956989_1_plen_20_part_01
MAQVTGWHRDDRGQAEYSLR